MFSTYVHSALLAIALAAASVKATLPLGVQVVHNAAPKASGAMGPTMSPAAAAAGNYFSEDYDALTTSDLLSVPTCNGGFDITILQAYDAGPGISYLQYSETSGPAYNWQFINNSTLVNAANAGKTDPQGNLLLSGNVIQAPPDGCQSQGSAPPEGVRIFAQSQYQTFDMLKFDYGIPADAPTLNNCVLKGVKSGYTDDNPTVSTMLGTNNNGQIAPAGASNGGPYMWVIPTGSDAGLWQGLEHITIKCDGVYQILIDRFQYYTPAPTS